MRDSSPRANGGESIKRRLRQIATRPHRWPTLTVTPTKDHPVDQSQLEAPALRDELAAGARRLIGQLRTLQDRYASEHHRLAQALEFLNTQRQDLERELATVSWLAESLANDADAATTLPADDAGPRAGSPLPLKAFDGLDIRCLGAFEVRLGGRRVDPGTSRNGRLVFKYLATQATKRASKEVLKELFWPDFDLERGLTNLQSAVSLLKRAMAQSHPGLAATPVIVYADDHYALNGGLELRCDVDTFRRRLTAARSCDARGDADGACRAYLLGHEAYGGELLPEERYEDWVAADRRALEADYLTALARLVQLHLARDEHQQAVHFGQLLLELDPSREDVHRDLMRCYSRAGRRSEAIRQYRSCFETLKNELDLLPEAETTELFERLVIGEAV